jgi:hypothetical protein
MTKTNSKDIIKQNLGFKDVRELYYRTIASAKLDLASKKSTEAMKLVQQIDQAIQTEESYIEMNETMETLLEAIRSGNRLFLYDKYIAAINLYAPTLRGLPKASPESILDIVMSTMKIDTSKADDMLALYNIKIDSPKLNPIQELYGLDELSLNKSISIGNLSETLGGFLNQTPSKKTKLVEILEEYALTALIIHGSNSIYYPGSIGKLMQKSSKVISYDLEFPVELVKAGEPLLEVIGSGKQSIILLEADKRYMLLGKHSKDVWTPLFKSIDFLRKSQQINRERAYAHEIIKHRNALEKLDDIKRFDVSEAMESTSIETYFKTKFDPKKSNKVQRANFNMNLQYLQDAIKSDNLNAFPVRSTESETFSAIQSMGF